MSAGARPRARRRPARLLTVHRYTDRHDRDPVATVDATYGLVMLPHADSASIAWLEKLSVDVSAESVELRVYVAGDPAAPERGDGGYVKLLVRPDGTFRMEG